MIKEYLKILNIKLTILGNQQLYSFKSSKIFNKIFKNTSYDNPTVVLFLAIYKFIKETLKLFMFNIFLIIVLLYIPELLIGVSELIPGVETKVTLNTGLIFYIPLIAILSNKLFKADEKKYNIVHLLKYNAKQYTMSEIIKYIIMTTLILIPGLGTLKLINNEFIMNLTILYYMNTYIFTNFLFLYLYEKKHMIITHTKKPFYSLLLSLVLIPFLLAILNIGINNLIYIIINIIILFINIILMIWYSKTNSIYKLYKENFSSYLNIIDDDQIIATRLDKSIKITNITNDKIENETGYKFFNDLFMERHEQILKGNTKIFSIILIFLFIISSLVLIIVPQSKEAFSDAITNHYMYFLYLIMVTNQGNRIIRAMFFHCDISMLKYNFYRNRKTILNLFKLRLISLFKINLLITILLTIGLDLLYLLSSGFNILILLLITISTIIISNFFSIFYMSLYYLIQPFTNNMKDRNFKFNLIIILTYVFIYEIALNFDINIVIATISCIIACIISTILFLLSVYTKAHKTFKLRNE